jgi:hypothetical protein
MKRRSASRATTLVAAAAVAVGSVTVGIGTATAQAPTGWELFGSSEPCPMGCQIPNYSTDEFWVENVKFRRDTPNSIERGSLVTFSSKFFLTPSDPARSITKVVDHPPAGYVLTGVEAKRVVDYENEALETGSVDVDRSTGAVTVTPPSGGWSMPMWEKTNHVEVRFIYHVPLTTPLGSVRSDTSVEVSGIDPLQVRPLSGEFQVVALEAEDLLPWPLGPLLGLGS